MIEILTLIAVTLVPGILAFGKIGNNGSWVKPLLSLSGSFLLALSFCHLLPAAYDAKGASIGVWVLVGFFLQVMLESVTKGVEHGHYHSHGNFSKYFPLLAILGLSTHSILEAIPLGTDMHDHNHGYLTGIAMHKFPIALTLASILANTPIKPWLRWAWFSVFILSAPLGILLEPYMVSSASANHIFTSIAVGIFLHVSTTILFEMEDGHRLKPSKLLAIVLGLAIYFITQ